MKGLLTFIVLLILGLLATLPFHYVPSRSMVFPKDHFTFEYTIINQSDIDKIIERYNNSSFIEQVAMNNEAIVRKLKEHGLIADKNSNDEEESNANDNSDEIQPPRPPNNDEKEETNTNNHLDGIITAAQLTKEYYSDEKVADKLYKNAEVRVEGVVNFQDIARGKSILVMILHGEEGSSWNVTFAMKDKFSDNLVGKHVTIQGYCIGKSSEGQVIIIENCYMIP